MHTHTQVHTRTHARARTPPAASSYQGFPQHFDGRAGFPQGLLREGLGLARSTRSGSLAGVQVPLLRLHGRPGLLVDSGKGALVIGQGLGLQGRKGLQSSRVDPARHPSTRQAHCRGRPRLTRVRAKPQ